MLIASIIIMIAFALICAFLVLALVEMYIVVSASVLMMGFAGSQWTKDYALKTIQYAVSVGAKIFILQLIAGLGLTFIKEWATDFNVEDNVSLVGMIGCSVVLLALTKIVPDMLQGVINGSSIGSGAALTSALRAVAAATAGAAAGAAGASMATKGAGALASEQLKTAQATGTGPSSAMGKAGFMAGNMAMNMSSALKSDLGSRLSGSTTGGRMAGSMMDRANELRSKRSKSNQDENTIS
jgi:type IV secretion system protein TrbL